MKTQTKKTIKKIAVYSVSIFVFLVGVLAFHIWWVYRPKAPDTYTRVMARIDIKQPIDQGEADKINAWLYHQKGIDHVLVNPQSQIVVFTFAPVKTTANEVVKNFKANFRLRADRFAPSATDLANSCPMAGSSYTYKVYKFISHIL